MKSKLFIVWVLAFSGWMAWNAYHAIEPAKNKIVAALKVNIGE